MTPIQPNAHTPVLPPPPRYWFPLNFFLSTAFQPTALIGLDKEMRMPKMGEEGLNCACRPSLFAYPSPVTAEVKETVSKQERHRLRSDVT